MPGIANGMIPLGPGQMAIDIGRRDFIALLGGTSLAWPLAARAQQAGGMRRIGVLGNIAADDPQNQARYAAFLQGLEQLGWTDGRNVRIDSRWAAGNAADTRKYAGELVALAPEVILAAATNAAAALRQNTFSIPIVFAQVPDPIELGFVASLAHPGGNITGFTDFEPAIGGKWLQVLKELGPGVNQVVLIFDPDNPSWIVYVRALETAAASFGVRLSPAGVHDASEIEHALTMFAGQANGGLIVIPSPASTGHRDLIVGLAAQHRLPAIYPFHYFAAAGGLISYGPDPIDLFRRAAGYVDRILKGEKPADLPVQQPTKYELVINLKTAKALGLTVPTSLLATADEVIE